MTAGVCWSVRCDSTETRRYLVGPACALHTPAAIAGRPEPDTLVDPARTEKAMRVMHSPEWAKGATDVNKERRGGYVSKQAAVKIANHQRPRQA